MQKSFFTDYRFQVGATVLLYAGLSAFYNFSSLHTLLWWREIILWPFLGLIAACYIGLYRQIAAGIVPRRALIFSAVLFALIAVTIPPFHSTDVFGYINRGWQQAHYGLNPYVYTVDHIPGWQNDPMITDHWVSNPSPYGFLYLQIAKALCSFGFESKAATLWLFKLSNVLVHLATAGLVWLGVSRFAAINSRSHESAQEDNISDEVGIFGRWFPPSLNLAEAAFALYAFNPLILLHGLANGHNDLWMGLFLTLTALCSMGAAGFVGLLPTLTASVLVKYGSIVLFPFAGLFLFRQKAWKGLLIGSLLSLIVVAVTGMPYLPDWSQFHLKEIGRNAVVSHSSLHSFIFSLWKVIATALHPEWRAHKEVVRETLSKILIGSFALFYIGLFFKRLRQAVYDGLSWRRDAILILVVLITLVSLKFYAWYLGLFLAMSFFLPEKDWLRRLVLALSVAQLLSFTIVGQAHMLNFFLMTALPWLWVALPGLGWSRQKIGIVAVGLLLGLLLIAFGVCVIVPAPPPLQAFVFNH